MTGRLFVKGKFDNNRGLYFKLRRHLIDNFRNALICKIINNGCRVVLTPLGSSDCNQLGLSDSAVAENVSAGYTFSPSTPFLLPDESTSLIKSIQKNLQTVLSPLPISILDRYPPSMPPTRGQAFEQVCSFFSIILIIKSFIITSFFILASQSRSNIIVANRYVRFYFRPH